MYPYIQLHSSYMCKHTHTHTCIHTHRNIPPPPTHTHHLTAFTENMCICQPKRQQNNMFVGCLTSQQHVSESQRWICSDKFTYCHTEIEAADHTFCLTQSQYTYTGPTSPSADPKKVRHLAGKPQQSQFLSHWYYSTQKNPHGTNGN